jgi:hypothetical protein
VRTWRVARARFVSALSAQRSKLKAQSSKLTAQSSPNSLRPFAAAALAGRSRATWRLSTADGSGASAAAPDLRTSSRRPARRRRRWRWRLPRARRRRSPRPAADDSACTSGPIRSNRARCARDVRRLAVRPTRPHLRGMAAATAERPAAGRGLTRRRQGLWARRPATASRADPSAANLARRRVARRGRWPSRRRVVTNRGVLASERVWRWSSSLPWQVSAGSRVCAGPTSLPRIVYRTVTERRGPPAALSLSL